MVMINDISFERRFVSLMIRGCQDSRQESYYFNNGLFSSLKFESDKDMTIVWEQSSFVCIPDLLTEQGDVYPLCQYIVAPNALHPYIAAKEKKNTI